MLHHDNAAPHKGRLTVQFLEQQGITLLPHPPYSPDLASCDFWLFPNQGYEKAFISIQKALKYVASHPSLQLHDAAVRKENRVVPVNAVTVNAVTTDHTMYRPQNVRNIHCQRCGRNNHTIQNCRTIECFRCHKWGHFASQCTVKLPPIPPRARPTVTCFTCGVQGHASKDCMNNSRRYTTYQTQKKNANLPPTQPHESVVITAVNSDTGNVSIEVQIENESVLALMDTGAGVSLVSRDVVDKLRKKHITPTNKVIRNASGDEMLTSGKTKLTLTIGGKIYTHDFVISEDRALPSQIIIGFDFMKRYNVNLNTKPLQLYIEGRRIVIVEIPMMHAIMITERSEKEAVTNESKDNPSYKCSVAQTSILQGVRVSYVTLETKLVDSDIAIFEPVKGVIGSQFLCPGLVKLENDMEKKKSRFVVRYINFSSEHVPLEPGKTLGYLQSCQSEVLPSGSDEYTVNGVTEENETDKMKAFSEIINHMYPEGTRKNQILKELVVKYSSVFASDDDIPSISPFFYHTIQLQSRPTSKKPYPIPACFYDKTVGLCMGYVQAWDVPQSSPPQQGMSFSQDHQLLVTGQAYVVPFLLKLEDIYEPIKKAINITQNIIYNLDKIAGDDLIINQNMIYNLDEIEGDDFILFTSLISQHILAFQERLKNLHASMQDFLMHIVANDIPQPRRKKGEQ
ncbi:uncharacterized protein LOC123500495 [Portunus trituberculatus]|uniref:uncharacterized protein LOC123500495 n=1 Tax=Portunus trituberculatus TaxID=210409 RepID=UPI001E1CD08C|nr:uncharacterized protein LOC123500495 [Portunus trituberculatus]